MHVDDETSHAFVFRQAWVGATDHFTDVAVLRARCPNFLTRNDPFFTVALSFCLQRREITASTRL